MILKVNHKELEEVDKKMFQDATGIEEEIEKLIGMTESLRGIWKGQDSDIFYEEASNYFNKMKKIPNCLFTIDKVMKEANGSYQENDRKFQNELKKEADTYE